MAAPRPKSDQKDFLEETLQLLPVTTAVGMGIIDLGACIA